MRRRSPAIRASVVATSLATVLATTLIAAHPALAQMPAIDRGDAVVTGFPGIVPSKIPPGPGQNPLDHFFIDLDGPSAQVLSLRSMAGPASGQLAAPAAKLRVKAGQVGQVFATALAPGQGAADVPLAYLGATSAYGLHIIDPEGAGPGVPKRLKIGKPGAQWMPGMFGTAAGGGAGAIWRMDGATGAVTLFSNLPGNSGPGVGDIVADPARGQVFASDLDNGLIHRIGADGTVIDSFDHGIAGRPAKGQPVVVDDGRKADINDPAFDTTSPATWGYTQPERRVWGMALRDDRLYYAVAGGLEIWSVGIAANGAFAGDPRWELDVTGLPGSGPITDLLFDADGRLFLAQRGEARGSYDFSVYAEPAKSPVLRYRKESPDDPATPSVWSLDRAEYAIGMQPEHRFAAGGIALGYRHDQTGALRGGTCGSTIWSTGDRLAQSVASIDGAPHVFDVHGLQGNDVALVRPQNTPPSASYFIDYDTISGDAVKAGHVGDVEIWQPCGADFAAQQGGYLPPGYLPPGNIPPPVFPDPEYPFSANLELRKYSAGACFPWGGGWACRYDIRIRNTGPDFYWAPIVVRDHLPAAPAGALMGFANTPPWNCWTAGPSNYGCWRPATFLAPGASVWLTAYAWVPNSYPHCHLQNIAEITWAPGGSVWNSDPIDDIDDATALIPAQQCPPPGGNTNLRLEKKSDPQNCQPWQQDFLCRYHVTVTNTGPGVYNGPVVVREEPLPGATAFFSFPWACVPAGGGFNCTHPAVVLNPAQQLNLWVVAQVTKPQAAATGCSIENKARILAAPGGSPANTNPADDADDATAFAPAEICLVVAPAQCPAGFNMKDGSCVSNRVSPPAPPRPPVTPPVVVPLPPIDPPTRCTGDLVRDREGRCVCPDGEIRIGSTNQCRRPTTPDCTGGQIRDDGRCVCPSSRPVWDGKMCKEREKPKACIGTMVLVDGKCVCPSGMIQRGNTCVSRPTPPKPETCKGGQVRVGSQCICPSGTKWEPRKGSCVRPPVVTTCPPGKRAVGKACLPIGTIGKKPDTFKPLPIRPLPKGGQNQGQIKRPINR